MEDWSHVRVLVTGGSLGIGRGIAAGFAAAGARVGIAGRDEQRLIAAQKALAEEGKHVDTFIADVSSSRGCLRLAEQVSEEFGGLDVLCINAGIYPDAPVGGSTDEHIDSVTAVNLKGTIYSVQAMLPLLLTSRRGRIVMTSSVTGPITEFPGFSVFAATKAGQLGYMRSAAVELASKRVTVNAVLPGSIRTDGLSELGDEAISQMERVIPVGCLGDVEDIANAVIYLAGEGAGFVTGQTLVVDGGQTLPEIPTFCKPVRTTRGPWRSNVLPTHR